MDDQDVHEDFPEATRSVRQQRRLHFQHGEAPVKPTANRNIPKLRPLAPPGTWTVVCSSHGSSTGHLDREGWAAGCATVERPIVPKITGPKFFSPGLVETSDSAGDSDDHLANATPNGNLTAKSPHTDVLYTMP